MRTLKELDLSNNKLGSKGMLKLGQALDNLSRKVSKLNSINLSKNQIEMSGLTLLLDPLCRNQYLTYLNITDNSFMAFKV